MTALSRWEPIRELASLQDRMNRVFTDSFNPVTSQESLSAGSFVPLVDVYEDEQGIRLKMEVPGIDEKDIDIRLENNLLTAGASASWRARPRKKTTTVLSAAMGALPVPSRCRTR